MFLFKKLRPFVALKQNLKKVAVPASASLTESTLDFPSTRRRLFR